MRERVTFILTGDKGSFVRQLTLPAWVLGATAAALTIGLCLAGYVANDYIAMHRIYTAAQQQNRIIDDQRELIRAQREDIQDFAQKINQLHQKLAELTTFENKIKVIANIEAAGEDDFLIGTGGTIPGDADAVSLTKAQYGVLLREMHARINHLARTTETKIDQFDQLLHNLREQRVLLASTPAIRPVDGGWITSSFGYRTSPFTGKREFHSGLDIAARSGTPIVAPADGVVTFVGSKAFSGNMVVIDHGHGMTTTYCHIKRSLKKKGERVKRGDVIAEVGNTGRSTGPHLHYEVHVNGKAVNPVSYILN